MLDHFVWIRLIAQRIYAKPKFTSHTCSEFHGRPGTFTNIEIEMKEDTLIDENKYALPTLVVVPSGVVFKQWTVAVTNETSLKALVVQNTKDIENLYDVLKLGCVTDYHLKT